MSLLQMSISGAVMILVTVVIRALFLRRLPKRVFPVLWGVVLVRLLIPYSLPCPLSAYSLLTGIGAVEDNSGNVTAPPAADLSSGNTAAPSEPGLSSENTPEPSPSDFSPENTPAPSEPDFSPENRFPSHIWSAVWIIGMSSCAIFFGISYIRCRVKFQESLPAENICIDQWLTEHPLSRRISVRQSDRIAAPLTYGVLRPVILLPKNYQKMSTDDLKLVLTHEYVHIRRFDAGFKLLLVAALCVHWFNPMVWVMLSVANKDIEISCDEAVVRTLGETEKKRYAMTLIRMEETKSGFTPLINSFGNSVIKERIITIMNFKKTTALTIAAAAVLVVGITIAFATTAQHRGNDLPDTSDTNSDVSAQPQSDTTSADPNSSDGFIESNISLPEPSTHSEPQPIDLGDGVTAA